VAGESTENLTLRMRASGSARTARDVRRVKREVDDLGDDARGSAAGVAALNYEVKRAGKTHRMVSSIKTFTSGLLGLADGGGAAAGALGGGGSGGVPSPAAAGGGGGSLFTSIAGISGISGFAIPVLYGLAGVIGVALVAAAVALAASLVVAAAGVAALATAGAAALGGTMAVGFLLAAVAAKRFASESKTAGTAAYGLRRAAGRTFDTMIRTWGPAVDVIFRALTTALKAVRPLITALAGPMLLLGQAVAAGIGQFSTMLTSPAFVSGLQQFIVGMSQLVGPSVRIANVLLPFFLSIANEALPVIANLLNQAAAALQRWLGGGRGLQKFNGLLAYALPYLQGWWNLIKAVGGALLALVRVAAPFGLQIVQWLTQIVNKWTAWMNSQQGQQRMREFFAAVIPLAKSVLTFIGRLVVLILQIAQVVAPALNVFVSGLNLVIGALVKVVEWVRKPIGFLIKWANPIGAAIGTVRILIGLLPKIWDWAKRIASKVWNWLDPIGKVKAAFGFIKDLVKRIWAWISAAVSKAGGLVKKLSPIHIKHIGPVPVPVPHIPGFASGGPIHAGQPAVVGENGPELFKPDVSGHIVPNHDAFATGDTYVASTVVMPDGSVLARSTTRAARKKKAVR
jgi:hypothetical protein